jgi:hypothetical protein
MMTDRSEDLNSLQKEKKMKNDLTVTIEKDDNNNVKLELFGSEGLTFKDVLLSIQFLLHHVHEQAPNGPHKFSILLCQTLLEKLAGGKIDHIEEEPNNKEFEESNEKNENLN